MAGILAWFALSGPLSWLAVMGGGAGLVFVARQVWPRESAAGYAHVHLRQAVIAGSLVINAGLAVVWLRSEMVGAEAIPAPRVELLHGLVLECEDQPAEGRIRLNLAVRDSATLEARKVRINVPLEGLSGTAASPALAEGAAVRLRARLMPPAAPILPGSYNFARAAWFQGLTATGSVMGPVEVMRAATTRRKDRHPPACLGRACPFSGGRLGRSNCRRFCQRRPRQYQRGGRDCAARFGSHPSAIDQRPARQRGDRGCIFRGGAAAGAVARAGLADSAAGSSGERGGVGRDRLYPADRCRSADRSQLYRRAACLGALALGRDALSLRMVAVAGGFVLLLWPESAIGPSFQMSFSAVLAIIALSDSAPVQAFLAAREEHWWSHLARRVAMLFATGLVIELALMPIVLFHFHRAGLYGALANVVAIPLVTFVSMPLIALGLVFDLIGAGALVGLCSGPLGDPAGVAHLRARSACVWRREAGGDYDDRPR